MIQENLHSSPGLGCGCLWGHYLASHRNNPSHSETRQQGRGLRGQEVGGSPEWLPWVTWSIFSRTVPSPSQVSVHSTWLSRGSLSTLKALLTPVLSSDPLAPLWAGHTVAQSLEWHKHGLTYSTLKEATGSEINIQERLREPRPRKEEREGEKERGAPPPGPSPLRAWSSRILPRSRKVSLPCGSTKDTRREGKDGYCHSAPLYCKSDGVKPEAVI